MGNNLKKLKRKDKLASKEICNAVCYSYGIWTYVLPNLTNIE